MKKKAKEIKKKNLISNIQSLISDHRGITLMTLVITVVLMLILASITIGATLNGGLFNYAGKAKIKTELKDLDEQLANYQIINNTTIAEGKINDILGIDSPYNDKLKIENGKLVYSASEWSQEETEMLEEMGINISSYDTYNQNKDTIYYIANLSTKQNKYADLTNVGTLEDFRNLVNTGTFTYDEARVIEDIKLNEGKYTITNGEITFAEDATQWTPIGTSTITKFTKVFDGQNHKISGIYINDSTLNQQGLFGYSAGTIKNIGITKGKIVAKGNSGAIIGYASGR